MVRAAAIFVAVAACSLTGPAGAVRVMDRGDWIVELSRVWHAARLFHPRASASPSAEGAGPTLSSPALPEA